MANEATGPAIGPGEFWTALGARPVGVTVVTTAGPAGRAGFLGLSFAHVSAAPPVVLVSVGSSTSALGAIRDSGVFAVNLLDDTDAALAPAFGGGQSVDDRFAGADWAGFVTGSPVLKTALAVFDCKVIQTVQTDGAVTFLGSVAGLRSRAGVPLTAYRGRFMPFAGD